METILSERFLIRVLSMAVSGFEGVRRFELKSPVMRIWLYEGIIFERDPKKR